MRKMTKKEKTEKKVINKKTEKSIHKYTLEELADIFGISITTMRTMYKIRGLNREEKLSYDEASKKFNNVM